MAKKFTNADLQGWYGYHRSGTLLTDNHTLQTVASVGFIYFDGGGKYGEGADAGVWQSVEITTKLDTDIHTGSTVGVALPIGNTKDIDPPAQNGFYQVKSDGTFKMWLSANADGTNGTVAAWGVLVGNDEYYAMSMQADHAVTLIAKKTAR